MTKERLGLYENLSEDDYHSDSALGSTDIKELYISPQTWGFKRLCPEAFKATKRNPSFIIGSGLHKLTLEGVKAFLDSYRVNIGDDLRIKKYFNIFRGETILKRSEFENIKSLFRILEKHEDSRRLLDLDKGAKGKIRSELSCFWETEGIRFKARFDRLRRDNLIVDLKTATFKSFNFNQSLNKYIGDFQLDIQTKHYLNGYYNCFEKEGKFLNLIIETNPPHRVAYKVLHEDVLEFARLKIDIAIKNYKSLRDNGWALDDKYDQLTTMDDIPYYNTERFRLEERRMEYS